MLDTVKGWVGAFTGEPLSVDYMASAAPGTGLYPKGYQQLRRSVDILGNESVRYRCSFILKRTVAGLEDKTRAARWMLDFQNWVRTSTDAPQLGMDTLWRAENGKFEKVTQAGTGIYTVELVAEFTETTGGNL